MITIFSFSSVTVIVSGSDVVSAGGFSEGRLFVSPPTSLIADTLSSDFSPDFWQPATDKIVNRTK